MGTTRQQRFQWGLQLRALRKLAHVDQVTLASTVGVSQGTVSRWERGVMAPKPAARERIAAALGLPVDAVFAN